MIYFEDFDTYYKIYTDGRLWSYRQHRFLKPSTDKDGYLRHQLSDGNKKLYQCKVHRLVALQYTPTKDTSLTVNHKDADRTNNNVDNLEWMTHSDNVKEAWARGAYKYITHKKEEETGLFVGC